MRWGNGFSTPGKQKADFSDWVDVAGRRRPGSSILTNRLQAAFHASEHLIPDRTFPSEAAEKAERNRITFASAADYSARVVGIADGDTITVPTPARRQIKIRL